MIKMIRECEFLISPLAIVIAIAITSLLLLLMVIASNDSTVRTSGAQCQVGETLVGTDTIRVKLECDEAGSKTNTSTSRPEAVVAIIKTNPTTVVCNVMHTGWARDCRVP